MGEIDEMDMLGFLHVRAWHARQGKREQPRKTTIDTIWPGLKP